MAFKSLFKAKIDNTNSKLFNRYLLGPFLFLFGVPFILYQLIPSTLVVVLSLIYTVVPFVCIARKHGIRIAFLSLSISLMPISFISLIGGSTASFPISLYHIVIIISFIISLFHSPKTSYLICILFILIFGFLSSMFQPMPLDGLKQVLNILLFCFSFCICSSFKNRKDKKLFFLFSHLFISSCLVVAFHVFIQYAMYRFVGLELGHMVVYSQRLCFGGIMGDYSFATVYLACGFLLVFLIRDIYKAMKIRTLIIEEIILLVALVLVSARTGLIALAIIIFIYFIPRLVTISRKKLFLLAIVIAGGIFALYKMQQLRGSQGLLESSGRIDNYIEALDIFSQHFFFGVGFGLNNLSINENIIVPHNFFVQYLCQTGIVGTLLICFPFLLFILNECRYSKLSKWVFALVFVGSMFIPDIVNSRFLFAVVILAFFEPLKEEPISQEQEPIANNCLSEA